MGIADLAKKVNVNVTEGEIAPGGNQKQLENQTKPPVSGKQTGTVSGSTGSGSPGGGMQSTGAGHASGGRTRSGSSTPSGGSGGTAQSAAGRSGSASGGAGTLTGGRTRSGGSTSAGNSGGTAQSATGRSGSASGGAGTLTGGNHAAAQSAQVLVFPVGGSQGISGGPGYLTGARSRGKIRTRGHLDGRHFGSMTAHLPELWGVDALCIAITVMGLVRVIMHWDEVILQIARFLVRLASFALGIACLAGLGIALFLYVRSRSRRRRW